MARGWCGAYQQFPCFIHDCMLRCLCFFVLIKTIRKQCDLNANCAHVIWSAPWHPSNCSRFFFSICKEGFWIFNQRLEIAPHAGLTDNFLVFAHMEVLNGHLSWKICFIVHFNFVVNLPIFFFVPWLQKQNKKGILSLSCRGHCDLLLYRCFKIKFVCYKISFPLCIGSKSWTMIKILSMHVIQCISMHINVYNCICFIFNYDFEWPQGDCVFSLGD